MMWTVVFQVLLAAALVVLTLVMIIHKLLISRQLSDKYYKNFALALLGLSVCICGFASYLIGLEARGMLSMIKTGNLALEEANKLYNNLLTAQNQQTIYLIACMAFFGLILLLMRSISKDIKADFEKPKYRWTKSDEKSVEN